MDSAGNVVFVARENPGEGGFLDVIALTDPAAPELVVSIPLPGAAWDVAVSGGLAYVAGAGFLDVLDLGSAIMDVVAP